MSDVNAFAERILSSSIATMDMFSIHLGDRLGFYRAMRDAIETEFWRFYRLHRA
jgi:hypothetical protein